MWEKHPDLNNRLREIVGCVTYDQVSVLSINILDNFVSIEIKIHFDLNNIPENFQKKSRNCLIFQLSAFEFSLDIDSVASMDSSNKIEEITHSVMIVYLGKYRYHFKANKIHFGNFVSVDDMDLIDEEF